MSRFLASWCVGVCACALAAGSRGQCRPDWLPDAGLAALNGSVNALAVWDDGSGPALYAGGAFTTAGGDAASRIARWDGRRWASLGEGLNGAVNALLVHEGRLIAGGAFTKSGTAVVNRLASWNGASWSEFAGGADGTINALAHYQGALVAGGAARAFGGRGGVAQLTADRVASWDGSAWRALGSGTSGTVWSLCEFSGSLIVGGDFMSAGGVPAQRLARWDGAAWLALGGADQRVRSMLVDGGRLVYGGDFTSTGGKPADRVARLNAAFGVEYFSAGVTNGAVRAIASHAGELYIAGDFTLVAGEACNRIARFDGSAWRSVSCNNVDGPVSALAPFGGDLIAGGSFLVAGRRTTPHLARLSSCVCPGDVNVDGLVDFVDVLDYFNFAEDRDRAGDLNCDGVVDGADFDALLSALPGGC